MSDEDRDAHVVIGVLEVGAASWRGRHGHRSGSRPLARRRVVG